MKVTIQEIISLKGSRKITMLTAYDFPLALLADRAGIDIILVGDSLANVVLGLDSTTQVGMAEMLIAAKAVTRAAKRALVVGDMPYGSYQLRPEECVKNARRFISEAGCAAVKLEWFKECLKVSGMIIGAGIPVMGHIGLTPQTAQQDGGFKVRGKDAEAARQLIEQALALEKAGCFSLVLECVPDKVSGIISRKLRIPVIGIGAGAECDGQVLVIHDILGLFERYTPKFVKRYAALSPLILKAIEEYRDEVVQNKFPAEAHSFHISDEELKRIRDYA
jgi:3-methyl-2-oxobutanoate hydroxymethyltransferase